MKQAAGFILAFTAFTLAIGAATLYSECNLMAVHHGHPVGNHSR